MTWSRRDTSPALTLVADRALRKWEAPGPVTAVLVKGSGGATGTVPLGGDLDFLVVVDEQAGTMPGAELRVDGIPIEIFPRSDASLQDTDEILRHQSLPLEVVANLHLLDRRGTLARVRSEITPNLFAHRFVRARVKVSQQAADQHLRNADEVSQAGEWPRAARELTLALWHGAAAAAAASHLRPTTRRCLALWASTLVSSERLDELALLETAAGDAISAGVRADLVGVLERADDRVRDAVQGMVVSGEERWIALALLRSALWPPTADRHRGNARAAVLDNLGWGLASLRVRIRGATQLLCAPANLG